jgi:CHAD domain-containing protein
MRVTLRRLRALLRSSRRLLRRSTTDPVAEEIHWLANALGGARDREVLGEVLRRESARLSADAGAVGGSEAGSSLGADLGADADRLRSRTDEWSRQSAERSRTEVAATLDSPRYYALLDALEALAADPPLRGRARRPARQQFRKLARKEHRRVSRRIAEATRKPAGPARDRALHRARKAARRARYLGETAQPAVGKRARRYGKEMKRVQSVLGEQHDAVVAQGVVRALARVESDGRTAFALGLLHTRTRGLAEESESRLPKAWKKAGRRRLAHF